MKRAQKKLKVEIRSQEPFATEKLLYVINYD